MATRKRAASPAETDLARAKRRVQAARTPAAKAVAQRILTTQQRAHKGSPAASRAVPKKAAPKRE
jgi:hypothetical protein